MNTDPKTDPVKLSGHYIHKITYNYRERMVGLFVLSAFILFLILIVISGQSQHMFEDRVTFYIDVDSSEGIIRGNSVKALGTEVGTVTDLTLTQDSKIRLTLEVYEGRRSLIRTGSKAIVNRLANISSALIDIESDSYDAPILPDGSIIPVEETPSLNDLLLSVASIIQSADNNELLTKFETMIPKLETTIENVQQIISQIATGHGVLGAAVFDQEVEKELKIVVKSGAKILLEAEGIVSVAEKRLAQIEPLLTDAGYVVKDVRSVSKSLPEMVIELNQIIAQARTAMTLINSELGNLPGTVIETRRTLTKADGLLDSVQNIWPLSSDVKELPSSPLIPIHSSHE